MTNYKHSSFLCKGLLLVVSLVMGMSAGAYVFPDDGADITGNLDEMQVVLSERTVTFHDVNASDITEPTYSGAVIENLGTTAISGENTFTGNSAPNGGVLYNTGTATVGGDFDSNVASRWGGAIYNGGDLTISDGTTFTNNEAGSVGGAIVNALGTSVLNIGSDVSFEGNEAVNDGGAIGNYKGASLVNGTTFISNRAQTGTSDTNAIGGGAMSLGAESTTQISNATFTENTSGFNGGAIGTRHALSGNNTAASLDITNSTFTGNKAFGTVTSTFSRGSADGGNGGALDNHFYNSTNQAGYAYVSGSDFDSNEAINGGAIYNDGTADQAGNMAKLYVEDSTFTSNEATTNGGAIYNDGDLILAGTNTFTDNTAAGVANDIHNDGTLTVNGTTSLDGGVSGNGTMTVNGTLNIATAQVQADTLNFANGSTLGVDFANDTMGNLQANTINVDTTANLAVTLSRDFLTTDKVEHQLTNGGAVSGGDFVLSNTGNALYNISLDTDTYTVTTQRKSTEEEEEAIEEAGGNKNAASVIEAFTSSADLGSDAANQMGEVLNQLAQTDVAAAVQAAKALAPEESYSRQMVHTVNTNELFSAVGAHISAVTGGTSAPRTYALGKNGSSYQGHDYSVWAQGLLNKSHKEATSTSAFTGRSTGLAGGFDKTWDDTWLTGLGYAYTHTNVDATARHNRILGDNFIAYAQYKQDNFFVQGAFTYGDSKYEERKYVAGDKINADYHIHSYALNLTAGLDVNEWLTPLAGIRYLVLHQEGYKDTADQSVAAEQNSYFTGTLGAQLQQAYTLSNGMRLIPQFHAGFAYDFVSDSMNSRVGLPNGVSYEIQGDRLHRLSFETGLSVTALLTEQVELSAGYEGSFRTDYNSHTGTLKVRYMF